MRPSRLALSLCLASLWVSLLPASAFAAQADNGVALSLVETDSFPELRFYFETYDESGNFIEDLQPEEIRVIEDGVPRPLEVLEKFEPGVQFIAAINTAPVFLNQVAGVSLYGRVQEALASWARTQDAGGLGDYSLASNTGLQAIRLDDPQEFASAIQSYQPDLLTLQPSMVSLSQALDLATDPNPSPLMKRTILYVTGLPLSTQVAALPNMADRAAQLGVRIQVWLVGYPGQENTIAGEALRQMAERTGGSLFVYSGLQEFPDIQAYLQPLRYVYRGSYPSGIRASGPHRLAVQVQREGMRFTSQERVFNLTVLPPNPILISPPSQVQRVWTRPEDKKEKERLEPEAFAVQFLVEFPDGHRRDIVRASLLVDGEAVAEMTQPPFDALDWPLAAYTETGKHWIKVQVEDQLGFIQETIAVPVEVVVEPTRRGLFGGLVSPERLAIAAAVLVAGAILAAVLFSISRRRVFPTARSRRAARDPVTQPVPIRQEPLLQRSAAADVKTARRSENPLPAPARLTRVVEDSLAVEGNYIQLSRNQVTFGSDASQAVIVLDDPSVSKLHARLHHTPDGRYLLNDAGSISGTWVNYTPVSPLGVQLKHGDLIHFGWMAFRFELSNPGELPQPVVMPYPEETL
ncbi:MAG: FHA domain-containing protein [Anaerolineae bacterium]|nr:FHA domain-containing protein [Anaerolineae bacterium]